MRVFHTVFNTCGKVVDFLSLLHSFSHQHRCFCRHAPPVSLCNVKNERRWKSLREVLFCSTFFLFSTTVFHSQELRKKANAVRFPKKEHFFGGQVIRKLILRIFPLIFSTPKKSVKNVVNAPHPLLLSLSTVSAGSTNITINYSYHSFVIERYAQKRARGYQERNFCYEDHIQPPIRK